MKPQLHVRFLIMDHGFSPEVITKVLGIKPTKTYNEGDLMPDSKFKYKTNLWELRSRLSKYRELSDHINYLFSKITPVSGKLKELTRKYSAVLSCAVYCHDSSPSLFFDEDVLRKLSELHIAVDIDIILL
jgi:hypothetical protein